METAKQGKETALNNANKYRNEKLPEAQAQADQIIQDAQAQKQVRINEAEAEVARFWLFVRVNRIWRTTAFLTRSQP